MRNAIAFLKQCPDVRFVIDHIAKPGIKDGLVEPWKTGIREIAAMPNTVCKIFGVVTEADHGNWTAEQIRPYVELGFTHLVFHAPGPDQARFLKLYAEQVLPLLRSKL